MLPSEDEFLSNDLFIRLSWSIYFESITSKPSDSTVDPQYYKDLESLISTTCLNKITLVHTLYYLYLLVNHKPFLYQASEFKPSSFQSSSRIKLLSSSNRKSSKELYELIVVLFMISNKANDDSSYTMKTWSNLTPLTNTTLKKKELVVLKKIQYNVFLKSDEYYKWCKQLFQICLQHGLVYQSPSSLSSTTYHPQPIPQPVSQPISQNFTYTQHSTPSDLNYPLTPKSPVQEASYLPLPIVSQQQVVQPHFSVSQSKKRSISSQAYSSPYKKQQYDSYYNTSKPNLYQSLNQPNSNLLLTPLKTNSYDYQNLYDQNNQGGNYYTNNATYLQPSHNNNHLNSNYINYDQPLPQQPQPQPQVQQQYQQYQPLQTYQQSYPIYGYQTQMPHPPNCACCHLTNYTNCYHTSLKSMVKL